MVVSTDWCWKEFFALDEPEKEWALDVLAKYVTDGDDAPDVLRSLIREGGECSTCSAQRTKT